MTAINISDLNNAKLDVDHIAAFATSTAPTVTDRLGHTKKSIAGAGAEIDASVAEVDARKVTALAVDIPAAIATLAAFNARGEWAASTAYALKDVYVSGGIAYVAVVAHVSTSVAADLAAGRVTVHQGATREDLAAADGAEKVVYTPPGSGAFSLNVKRKLDETVSVTRFGAKAIEDGFDTYDSTDSIYAALLSGESVFIPDGKNYRVSTVGVTAAKAKLYSNGGGVQAISSTQPCFYIAAPHAEFHGVKMRGMKPTTDYMDGASGLFVAASGCIVDGCDVGGFGFAGVNLAENGQNWDIVTVVRRSRIHGNSYGVRQLDTFEYASITDNVLTENGFNNAMTNFALDDTCGGYFGAMSNTSIVNNTAMNNLSGIYVNSSTGGNPDHNKISLNTINHNWMIGLRLQAIKNYVKVDGNIILSNILHSEAPLIKFAATNSAHDLVCVDIVDTTITGGAIGAGSFGDFVPIFGHGRCKYVGVHFLGCVPKEMREPLAGTPLHDVHGYTVNADNVFEGNTYAHASISKPVFMSSSLRNTNRNNLEHVDGAGVQNVDGVLKDPVMAASWVTPAATWWEPLKYWREGGNKVKVTGTFSFTGTPGAQAFTMPVDFRPSGNVDTNVVNEGAGTVATARFLATGEVLIYGATAGNILSMDATFTLP
jgi:hypothetical protein